MIRGFLIPAGIVAIFIFGAVTLMATAPVLEPDTPEPLAVTVRVREVTPEDLMLMVHSQGTAVPSTESQLIPEVSGRVEWVSPSLVAGGYFEKDAVLARIEPNDYHSARERAAAALKRAEAEQEHAKFEFQRMQSLAKRQLASVSQLENAQRASRVADATLTDAQLNFSEAKRELGRTELRAPFAGLVRSESVDVGQFVSRGNAIASIYASDKLEVRLPVSDRQLAFLNLPIGQQGAIAQDRQPRVTLSTDYAGRHITWPGAIVRTEAAIDINSRMIYLVARVDANASDTPLSVGLFVNAEIQGRMAQDVVVLPRTALRNDGRVLIVDAKNRLRYRQVETLRLFRDDVLIQSGLRAGDLVCISALQTAIDGMAVQPIMDPASDRPASPDLLIGKPEPQPAPETMEIALDERD